jgi:transcriptional regulator with XRE-family HTH domain
MTHPTGTLLPGAASRPDRVRSRPAEPLLRHLVGAILRARREDQGRTLRDVAESARVSVAYLSEVERGRKEPSSELLAAICEALDVALPDLLTDAAHALAGSTADAAPRLPIGLRHTDLRLAGADTALLGAPAAPLPLAPGRPVARAAA